MLFQSVLRVFSIFHFLLKEHLLEFVYSFCMYKNFVWFSHSSLPFYFHVSVIFLDGLYSFSSFFTHFFFFNSFCTIKKQLAKMYVIILIFTTWFPLPPTHNKFFHFTFTHNYHTFRYWVTSSTRKHNFLDFRYARKIFVHFCIPLQIFVFTVSSSNLSTINNTE